MTLFQLGNFTLRSGIKSNWKIECDSLTKEDWEAIALMAVEILPKFGVVEGVPRGGITFANALRKYSKSCSCSYKHPAHDWCEGNPLPLLICEDVITTGGSMERFRNGREAIGVALFCRGKCPNWVTPLFRMTLPSQD